MKKIIFQFRNIGVFYNKRFLKPWKRKKFWALQDVSFDVYHGETIGIIGPNGAGKSTMLRVAANIINPNRGTFIRETGIKASLLSLNAGANKMLSGRQNIFLNGLTSLSLGKIPKVLPRFSLVEFSPPLIFNFKNQGLFI